jgi:hypothetical protein
MQKGSTCNSFDLWRNEAVLCPFSALTENFYFGDNLAEQPFKPSLTSLQASACYCNAFFGTPPYMVKILNCHGVV